MALSKLDIQMFDKQFQRVIDANAAAISEFRKDMNRRFDEVDHWFDKIDQKFDDINKGNQKTNSLLRMQNSNLTDHEQRLHSLESVK